MTLWIARIIKGLVLLVAILLIIFIALLNLGPVSIPSVVLRDALGLNIATPEAQTLEQRLQLPSGFSINPYATGLKKVRILIFTEAGDLIVSQPRESRVLLLRRDQNGDGQHDGIEVLLEGLNKPHGLALYQGQLYVGEADAIGRVAIDQRQGRLEGDYQRIFEGLPGAVAHWPKSILIQEDKLYVNIGSSCNVCEEEDTRQGTIMQFDLSQAGTGSRGLIYATGLRNSVGMDISPWDGSLYATDNGRDLLGDDYPVCELNKIVAGGFYGWPYINGFGDLDPDFGSGKEPLLETAISPVFGFRAHNAPLGIEFLDRAEMPEGYERSALVALHGSWNRSIADGYKVISLHWEADGSISSRDFLSGFELAGDVIGRPVDIDEGPDGCVYISEDYAGTIYRVCYSSSQDESTQETQAPAAAVKLPEVPEKLPDPYWQGLTEAEREQAYQRGRQLYHRHSCNACHMLQGEGSANGKALVDLRHRYHSESLAAYFLTPNPPMPQYYLSEAQRLDLSIYLLSLAD